MRLSYNTMARASVKKSTTTTTPEVAEIVSVKEETIVPSVEKTTGSKKVRSKKTDSTVSVAPAVEEVSVPPVVQSVDVPVVDIDSENVKVDVAVDAEQSIGELITQFHANLQNLNSIISNLRSDFKLIEKKYQRDLKVAQKSSKKKKKKSGDRPPNGFVKPTRLCDELAIFLGKPIGTEMARPQVTKAITAYVKEHGLQNGKLIVPDDKLCQLLKLSDEDKSKLGYFNLQTFMKTLFVKSPVPTVAVETA